MRYHFVRYHFVCYHFEGLMRYYLYQNCCKFSFKNVLFKNFFEKNSKKYCHFIVTEKSKKSHKAFIYGLCGHIKLVFILFKLGLYGVKLKHICLGFVCFYLLIYLYYIICIILLISCCHSVATKIL